VVVPHCAGLAGSCSIRAGSIAECKHADTALPTACAGTPLFLPPEMFMRHWGPEADLWSLGMVTYLLLSGACCCRSFVP
jgi:serine/threonine protein kinase